MKKIKKLIFFIFLCILIFIMYVIFNENKITYISLGDSLALGQNPYGNIDYGYSDYIKDYLDDNNKLRYYTKEYATKGYRITDVLNDIESNKKINVNNAQEGIKTILRRSNLVTISIGSNDLLYKINNKIIYENDDNINTYINELINDYDKLLNELTKYFKGNLILIGYYNPYINKYAKESRVLEDSFMYINRCMEELADKYNAKYIDIYESFMKHPDYLPNYKDIHPSKKGYKQIADLIINKL